MSDFKFLEREVQEIKETQKKIWRALKGLKEYMFGWSNLPNLNRLY